jgi:hypothetical protein
VGEYGCNRAGPAVPLWNTGFPDAAVSHGRPCYPDIPRSTFSLQVAQKPWAFHIGVVQGIGEEHDAPRVAAVPEPVGVAQLVDGFLDGPLQKEGVIRRRAVELRSQACQ